MPQTHYRMIVEPSPYSSFGHLGRAQGATSLGAWLRISHFVVFETHLILGIITIPEFFSQPQSLFRHCLVPNYMRF